MESERKEGNGAGEGGENGAGERENGVLTLLDDFAHATVPMCKAHGYFRPKG